MIDNKNIVGALSKGNTYLLGEEGLIKDIFGKLSCHSIEIQDIPERLYCQKESFLLGLLYDFIEKSLINEYGLSLYKRGRSVRKIYSKKHPLSQTEIAAIQKWNSKFLIPRGITVHEGFEFKVELINKDLFFLICPCVHIENSNGREATREQVQLISNVIYSNRYNNTYGSKLIFWHNLLKNKNDAITFRLGNFEINYYHTFPQHQ